MSKRIRHWFKKRLPLHGPSDRGDVPGWVMIVIMTAGLVIVIWALAGEALTRVFDTAIQRILGA